MPSSISSGIDPRGKAITGVPQAIASTTLYPNGSSNPIRCRSAWAPPSSSDRSSGLTGPTNDTRSPSSLGATRSSKYAWSWTIPAITSGIPACTATSIASTVPLSG